MATYTIYDETAEKTKTVTVEFLGNVLAGSYTVSNAGPQYYFRISTSAKDTDGISFPNQLVLSLDDLVLNGAKQRRSDTASAYTNINDMIQDYIYDLINGHSANLYSSGVSYKAPMQF